MKLLIVGMGGVGSVIAKTIARNNRFEEVVCADMRKNQVNRVLSAVGRDNFKGMNLDVGNYREMKDAVARAHIVINATIPRFNLQIMEACLEGGTHYIDMASDGPVVLPGRVDIYQQLDFHERFKEAGLLAICGIGMDPGCSNIFARYLADQLDTVDEILIRDGDNSQVEGYRFALLFSPDTNIEECLQPHYSYENGEFKTGKPLVTGVGYFDFPAPLGKLKVYSISHEEVGTIPRYIFKGLKKCNFGYALPDQFVEVLKVLELLGLDGVEPIDVKGVKVKPRDVVTALLPDPADLAGKTRGHACVGTLVRGSKDGNKVAKYMYNMVTHEEAFEQMQEQATSYQTGIPPALAAELLLEGVIQDTGAVPPEALDPKPFVERLPLYGLPIQIEDR